MSNLQHAAWPSIPQKSWLIIPLGSTEQHGPHLPFTTDTVIAESVANEVGLRLNKANDSAIIAPSIPIGASGEHQDFPGTLSMGTEALISVIIECVRSASLWSSRIIFINGHGGNVAALTSGVVQMIAEGHDVGWVPCVLKHPKADAHAGYLETSLMMYLAPDRVDMTVAEPGNTEKLKEVLPRIHQDGLRTVSPNGVLGDPRGANAAEGQSMFEMLVSQISDAIENWSISSDGRVG